MIVKHEKKGGIDVYYVKKNITDAGMEKYKHQFVTPSLIDIIINDDADVYTDDNRLLMKFRKDKLSKEKIDTFYENMIDFARTTSTNRRRRCSRRWWCWRVSRWFPAETSPARTTALRHCWSRPGREEPWSKRAARRLLQLRPNWSSPRSCCPPSIAFTRRRCIFRPR